MIIGFIIWSVVALFFMGIGISCRKSVEAVGFFTGVKAPVVEDIKGYNKAVSMLWFIVATVLELMGVPFLFFKQNSAYFIFLALLVMGLMIGMIIAYLRIEAKYRK